MKASRLGWIVAFAALGVSCRTPATTGIRLEVYAGNVDQSLSAISSLHIRTFTPSTGAEVARTVIDVSFAHPLPQSLLIVPADLSDPNRSGDPALGVDVEAYVGASQSPTLRARVLTSFTPEQIVVLRVVFENACVGMTSCGDTQTCSGGQCVSASVSGLPRWGDDAATSDVPAGDVPDLDAGMDAAPDVPMGPDVIDTGPVYVACTNAGATGHSCPAGQMCVPPMPPPGNVNCCRPPTSFPPPTACAMAGCVAGESCVIDPMAHAICCTAAM